MVIGETKNELLTATDLLFIFIAMAMSKWGGDGVREEMKRYIQHLGTAMEFVQFGQSVMSRMKAFGKDVKSKDIRTLCPSVRPRGDLPGRSLIEMLCCRKDRATPFPEIQPDRSIHERKTKRPSFERFVKPALLLFIDDFERDWETYAAFANEKGQGVFNFDVLRAIFAPPFYSGLVPKKYVVFRCPRKFTARPKSHSLLATAQLYREFCLWNWLLDHPLKSRLAIARTLPRNCLYWRLLTSIPPVLET